MPYVPGFTNDIFISFSHVDNSHGWVKTLEDVLRSRLHQICGKEVTIWRDTALRRTNVFSDEIFAQLQESALLISVISPLGIDSPWCEDERRAFEHFAALNGGFRFGDYLRAVKVVKTPLLDDQHRDLFGVLGFEFYERDAHPDRFREFDPSSHEFWRKCDELAQDIKSVLDAFSQQLNSARRLDRVYVATTTPDLKRSRDVVVQQLDAWGYDVVPQDSKPLRRLASFQAVVKAELASSLFSVHLASDQPELIPEGRQDLITVQYELAQSLKKDRIVWVAPGRKPYTKFVDALDHSLQKRDEILEDCEIENLKEVIRDKLDQRSSESTGFRKSEVGVELYWTRDYPSKPSASAQQALNISENYNPFPGLRSFEREEAALFYGREEQINDLIARLKHRFLPMVGVSGSGKSSLVRAGLVPALTVGSADTPNSVWRIVTLRPGRNPMHELAATLCREFAVAEIETVLQTLRGSSAGLARIVRQHLRAGERFLVVVDQFEELFRYRVEDNSNGETDDDTRFVKLLLAAAGQSNHPLPGFDDLPVYVVTTMRSEYLGECSRFRGLPEALNRSQYLIPRLTRDQLRDVIEGPVAMADASIEPALVQRLLNDLGNNPDQLPLLQHALMCTWEQSHTARAHGKAITVGDYEAVGGMADALNHDADRIYERLSTDETNAAITRRLFQRLVAPDNESRSPTPFSKLIAIADSDEDNLKKIIGEFQERGLLTVSDERDSIVDITHESLIRGWRRLTMWVEEEKESAEIYRRLAYHAVQHKENKASLYIDPELQLTLNWCDETKPNEAWAARYDSRFAQAIEFLDKSRKQRNTAFEQAEQQRRTELKRVGQKALAFGTLFLLAIGLLFFAAITRNAAVAERDRSNRLLYDSNVYLASSAVASGQFTVARERLDELLNAGLGELRGFEWFYLWRAVHPDKATLSGHSGYVVSLAFSPDGKILASSSADKTVKLWNTTVLKELATLSGHSDSVWSIAFSRDGRILASASADRTVKLWDTTALKEMATLSGHSGSVLSVVFSPDGKILASASADKTVKLWDTSTWKELATLSTHSDSVWSVAFSPDGKILASTGYDKTLILWDTVTHEELATLSGHSGPVLSVAFSRDGRTLASASEDRTVKLWDAVTRKELATLSGHSDSVWSVAFSPDSKTLASVGYDKIVRLWDTATRKELAAFSGHAFYVLSVAFSPDGKTLASASADRTVKLWDTIIRSELPTLSGHSDSVWSVAFSPDGKTLASASADHKVKLWDTATHKELATLSGHSDSVVSAAFSPDGKYLASASNDKTVKLWDTATRKEVATLSGHSSYVYSVAFSPDGKLLASASHDNTVKLWDIATRKEVATLSGHSNFVRAVVFSPDGKTLASAGWDHSVKLWDVTARKELATFSGHSDSVVSVAFSPDGRTLASASSDQTVKLWDTTTRKMVATLSGHSDFVRAVAFSPDGKTLASASSDQTVKLWDTTTRQIVATLLGHSDYVRFVAFSPDGKALASVSRDSTVKLWIAATEEEVEERRRRGY